MIARFTSLAIGRPKRILIVAAVAVCVGAPIGTTAFDALDPAVFKDPGGESAKAEERLEGASGVRADGGVFALVRTQARTREGRARIGEVAAALARDPEVEEVRTPYAGGAPTWISRRGDSAYLVGFVRKDVDSAEFTERITESFAGERDVVLGGPVIAEDQLAEQSEKDAQRAELLAFPFLFILSLVFFRGLIAAALPLVLGAISVVGSLFAMRVLHEGIALSVLSINVVTALGLGLAIDYSLFVVSRFREELAGGHPTPDALRRTLATTGRTILFSSLTVACALASLLIFPQQFIYSMGVGGITVALLSACAALIVLPACLMLLGERVNSLAPAWLQRSRAATDLPDREGRWYRLCRWQMRRPLRVALVVGALLLVATLPITKIDFVPPTEGVLPESRSAGVIDRELAEGYAPGFADSIIVQLDGTAGRGGDERIAAYTKRLASYREVAGVFGPAPVGNGVARIDVVSSVGRYSHEARDLVRRIRSIEAPLPARVGGVAAVQIDDERTVVDHLPLALALLVVTTLLLVFLLTSSIVLPIKTLVMNLLSVGTALGVLVLVYQDGRFEDLLGYTSQGGLQLSIAVLVAFSAFGLTTDYGVFTISRMREAHDAGLPNDEAVSLGMERTGRIVTSAALLFAIAMGSLVTGQLVGVNQTGFGVAVAVLVDAFLVRAFLVPSLMALLGDRNWWLPERLRRVTRHAGHGWAAPAEPEAGGGAK